MAVADIAFRDRRPLCRILSRSTASGPSAARTPTSRRVGWSASPAEYDLDLRVRPVLPLAIRTPEFFERVHPLWPPYLMRDTTRIAESLGIPYGWPRPDPVVQEFPSRRISTPPAVHPPADQARDRCRRTGSGPVIHRRGLPAHLGRRRDRMARGIASGGRDPRAGLDLAQMDAAVAADAPATTPPSSATRSTSRRPAAGGSPPSRSRASRSSARTASICSCGGSGSTASKSDAPNGGMRSLRSLSRPTSFLES